MRASRALKALWADRQAAAAAEMVLVLPMLVVLMFGSYELGKYFLDEHVVVKSVRDGARYAARQGFAEYTCPGETVSSGVTDRTRNIVRYGVPAPTGSDLPRLPYWGALNGGQPSVTVTITCETSLDGTELHEGLYSGKAHVPVVTVSAIVDYDPLFGLLGFGGGFNLTAESQSAVMGL